VIQPAAQSLKIESRWNPAPLERPEHRLLLCVASQHREAVANSKVDQLTREDLDWDYLLALADRHGVIPFLHCRLELHGANVPARVFTQLRDRYQTISRSNLALTGQLFRKLDLFREHGIQAVPFKGPVLAMLAFGDIGLRQFLDLDILVRKPDVPKVRNLLCDEGFRPEPEIARGREAAWLKFDCSGAFIDGTDLVFDMHWDFVPGHSSLDTGVNDSWSRVQPTMLGAKQIMTLGVEDHLLALCFHGFTHDWERLGWISDVAGLINRQAEIDWEVLAQRAAKLGAVRILSLGLFLANDLLNAPLAPDILQMVRQDATVGRLARKIEGHLFDGRPARASIVEEMSVQLSIRERTRDKLKTALRLIVTPRRYDWEFVSVPESLFFLYYLLRPVRMAKQFGARMLRRDAENLVGENYPAQS